MTTEPAHTKFNLTYPPLPFNSSAIDGENINNTNPSTANTATIPGILFGILVPHIICTLVILARISSRLLLLRKWFLDDTLILLSWAFSTTVCIIYSIDSQSPPSNPLYMDSNNNNNNNNKIPPSTIHTYTTLLTYQLSLILTKLSILTFYTRILSKSSSSSRTPSPYNLTRLTTVFVLLYSIPLLILTIYQCHPAPGLFFNHPSERCFTFPPLLIASAALHSATDAWLIVLIVPWVVRLDLPGRQKGVLVGVLGAGVFVVVASLGRLGVSLGGIGGGGGGGGEVTRTGAFWVMTVLELDVAVVCACAPTLRPLVARWWPRLGMGEVDVAGGRRRSRWIPAVVVGGRRGRVYYRDGGEGGRGRSSSGSMDLTSVVSYHGYPWTQSATPARSKSNLHEQQQQHQEYYHSGAEDAPTMPMPPLARLSTYRTPTTLSLRSFISSMAPRSRGQTMAGHGADDKAGLLDHPSLARAGGHVVDRDDPEVLERRRSSVGFEGYFDQYLGYGEMVEGGSGGGKRRSRGLIRVGVETAAAGVVVRNSVVGRWADSQESFVLGVNDPNSPVSPTVNRLSPVLSDAGTVVAMEDPSGMMEKERALRLGGLDREVSPAAEKTGEKDAPSNAQK